MSRQRSLGRKQKDMLYTSINPLSMLGCPLGVHCPMAKTDYQAHGACNATSLGLFIRALGTSHVPWGNPHTPPGNRRAPPGDAIKTGEGRSARLASQTYHNTSSEQVFREQFGGLAVHWWRVRAWGVWLN